MPAIKLLPGAISEMLACVSSTCTITLADRYGLLAAVLDESLEQEERFAVDRLLRSVCRGRIRVIDELSLVI